jgi:hypothetical protein
MDDRRSLFRAMLGDGRPLLLLTRLALCASRVHPLQRQPCLCEHGAALGIHGAIGYLDFTHLAPAYLGLLLFVIGFTLCAIDS